MVGYVIHKPIDWQRPKQWQEKNVFGNYLQESRLIGMSFFVFCPTTADYIVSYNVQYVKEQHNGLIHG